MRIERARTKRPIGWLTLVGLLLLPAVVGGILVTALYNPVERLDALTAAIVNDDEPVTIDGQYVPLGRQLTAGLVEGSDEIASNLTWVVSNTEDAEWGVANGRYAAVVTIPSDFSAAATSTRPGQTPQQAVIEVQTSPDALIVDDAITAQVTQAAASLMSKELSKVYLENVLLGFTTLGGELGTAAGGAGELANGTRSLAGGTRELAAGTEELAAGTSELASGARQLADGSAQLPSGASQLATGAYALSGGAGSLAGGLDQLTAGIGSAAGGAGELSAGVRAGAAQVVAEGIVPNVILGYASDAADSTAATAQQIGGAVAGIGGAAQNVGSVSTGAGGLAQRLDGLDSDLGGLSDRLGGLTRELDELATACVGSGASEEFCARLATASETGHAAAADSRTAIDEAAAAAGDARAVSDSAATAQNEAAAAAASGGAAVQSAVDAARAAGYTNGAMRQFADEAPGAFAAQLTQIADGVDELGGGLTQLQTGAGQSAGGARALASGAGRLGAGGDQLASGAGQLAAGIAQLAEGTNGLAAGTSELAAGTTELADGTGALADGSGALADGLAQATDAIPSYTDAEARTLASVLASPVAAEGVGTNLFGASAVPLLAMLALWFGGLASFVVLRATSTRVLTSRAPSAVLALRSLAPAAGIGALQGLLVAIVVQIAAGYEWSAWWGFLLVAIVAGVAFAAVNQALVALFGGAGRWVSALIGVLAVATGVVSTVPGVLSQLAAVLPTAPAYTAMLAALGPASGFGAGLVGLTVWALLAVCATVLAVARRRTTSARALLAASPSA